MDILRITTAGSVDDGKSTLIGRLLFDTKSITNDKLEAIETTSKRKGLDFTDLSLLTDGLIAEREQGITIDVAYIYFSTPKRKYIIADTPGHIEYTRNMVTGASKASVFVILVDAREGITEQTRRHFYIASLLRITNVTVCINKMDLVGYDENIFKEIISNFNELILKTGFKEQHISYIPVNAKEGDNVVKVSKKMPWYKGNSLLNLLENIDSDLFIEQQARLPVQFVVRPQQDAFHDFRGFAGKVESGFFSIGDEVAVLPGLRKSKITGISCANLPVAKVSARESVVVTLEDDIDISRGNMLVKAGDSYNEITLLQATICWMVNEPLKAGAVFLLQHGINRVKSKILSVDAVLNIHTMQSETGKDLFYLNDIGEIKLKLGKPIFADRYIENPANGSFILIDNFSNNTVAVGFINNF
jgi:sulfate adenylyltransferase subunit 1